MEAGSKSSDKMQKIMVSRIRFIMTISCKGHASHYVRKMEKNCPFLNTGHLAVVRKCPFLALPYLV